MRHSTTDTYQLKRDILRFSSRICQGTGKSCQKFSADMLYGILSSSSCILSQMADALHEPIRKINTVDRLSRKLTEDVPQSVERCFLSVMKEQAQEGGTVFVDDTDIIKPCGKAFEALGTVRDGSAITPTIQKGYHVTEIVALTRRTKQPFSVYSHIHSSHETGYKSVNDITMRGLEHAFSIFPTSTYVFDRGYDMNKLFSFMHAHKKQFIVRLTERRNLLYKGKLLKSTVLRDSRKGKLKCTLNFQGQSVECWVSCINVQISESRKPLKLVLVYGLSETPMMLLTNRAVTSKDEAIRVVRMYMMRWRIEEYFRFKKQQFGFENIRVRSLKAMNTLNRYLGMALGYLALQGDKQDSSRLRISVMQASNAQKSERTIGFLLYRLGLGVQRILVRAHSGIRAWFHIGRPKCVQLSFPMLC